MTENRREQLTSIKIQIEKAYKVLDEVRDDEESARDGSCFGTFEYDTMTSAIVQLGFALDALDQAIERIESVIDV